MNEFNYAFSEKGPFLVISLSGDLDFTSAKKLEELHAETMQKTTATRIVLNFKDVTSLAKETVPHLAKLKKALRDRGGVLRICELNSGTRAALEKSGILRPEEFCERIQDAIAALQKN